MPGDRRRWPADGHGRFLPGDFSYFGRGKPIACVRWMGLHGHVDAYVAEKARNGSGRDAVTEYDTELARDDLREMLDDDDADDPSESRAHALQSGIDCMVQYDGREGVHEIIQAVFDEDPDLMESVWSIGQRPAKHLVLALQALNRLVSLLDAETRAG